METTQYRAYGRTISISGPSSALERVALCLPTTYGSVVDRRPERSWSVTPAAGGRWSVAADKAVLTWMDDVVAATEYMLSDLELWIAEHATRRVFVHAGCVVIDGRAIVLPGPSTSGKTSLTAAFVRRGAVYYSDEFAVVDGRGLVHPYARALAIRSSDGGPSRRVAVAELGGAAGRGPAPVGLIASVRFNEEQGWRIAPMSPAQSVLRLIENTVPAQTRPRAVLTALGHLSANAMGIYGTRDEAEVAVDRLLGLL